MEKRPESSSALLEQLLTSDDPPETTQRSIFGAASPGGAFVSTADGSKPSGFQAKLGQVTSPVTSEAGKEKAGFQFTFNLQKQQQSQQQPASPRSPEVDEHGFYLNRVTLLLPSLSSFSFSLHPHSTSTALHLQRFLSTAIKDWTTRVCGVCFFEGQWGCYPNQCLSLEPPQFQILRGDMVVQIDFFSLSNQDFAFMVI